MNKNVVLGLIPARGGSKGIPRKNIRLVCGRPLIEYTIESALKAKSLDRVIVSTDDAEIAKVAESAGAEVPFLRPNESSTDTATLVLVMKHAIDWFKTNCNYHPDAIALLPPTTPLRTSEDIDGTVDLLWASGRNSAVTVRLVREHPYNIYKMDTENKLVELIKIADKPKRRQEMPAYFVFCQSVIVSLTSYIQGCSNKDLEVNLNSVSGLEIDYENTIDIDTITDMKVVEILMQEKYGMTNSV